jgi:hypothetical protein
MSDENADFTTEDLVGMLSDEAYLASNGYRMTPKGYMALVLMECGAPNEVAAQVAQVISDRIFNAGYTYVDAQTLGIPDFPDYLGDSLD